MVYEWFTTVFSESSEQAKLFTIAISTILAVLLLLLNQWFVSSRTKNSRLIEKLEELASAVHEFSSLGYEVNRSFHLERKYDEGTVNKLLGAGIKIETLCSLYFSSSRIDTSISASIISIGTDELNKPKLPDGATIPSDHPYIEGNKELNAWSEEAQKEIKLLVRKLIK